MRTWPLIAAVAGTLLLTWACADRWEPHDSPSFALVGRHAEATCEGCHGDTLEALPTACASCHEAARPANHSASDCGGCHVPTRWDDAEFDHDDLFPLPHRGVDDCQDCHPDPSDGSVFTCIDCHAHREGEMRDEHDEVGRFEYESQACLDCHPRGREEDDR